MVRYVLLGGHRWGGRGRGYSGMDVTRREFLIGTAATTIVGTAAASLVAPLPAAALTNGPQSFTNSKIADVAAKYVGQARPTGWDQPGECIKWVQSWVREAGGAMAGGGPVAAFKNSPAIQVSTSEIQRGDVGQISKGDTYDGSPHTWVFASGRKSDGTYDIIEGNVPAGTGRVRTDRRSISVPANHDYRVWRFGRAKAPAPASPYRNKIVQWSGDQKAQKTSWFVTPDERRLWIPDAATYNYLKGRGFSGPHALSSAALDKLPDQGGKWAPNGPRLTKNRTLRRGMDVRAGDYQLQLQHDGNLVLIYRPKNKAVWATSWRTGSWAAQEYAVFQSDGNFVTYGSGRAIWNTGTAGKGADRFQLQGDGNLVVYKGSKALWNSGTNGKR